MYPNFSTTCNYFIGQGCQWRFGTHIFKGSVDDEKVQNSETLDCSQQTDGDILERWAFWSRIYEVLHYITWRRNMRMLDAYHKMSNATTLYTEALVKSKANNTIGWLANDLRKNWSASHWRKDDSNEEWVLINRRYCDWSQQN